MLKNCHKVCRKGLMNIEPLICTLFMEHLVHRTILYKLRMYNLIIKNGCISAAHPIIAVQYLIFSFYFFFQTVPLQQIGSNLQTALRLLYTIIGVYFTRVW